jgi:alpha-1,3-rhamnosyl/mannosyltransferase
MVSVVHDITAWTNPQWHQNRTLVGFAPLWERTAERAARLLCVSEATARELVRVYPETRERLRVVPNGVDAEFAPSTDPAAREETRRRHAGGKPYILYLGTLEPRKNVGTLVEACERIWSRRAGLPDLVLAGGSGWKSSALFDRIERSPFREKIHMPGYATRAVARDLYRAAEVFAYPSLAEGFGLPVLEAMACGVPVVASTAEALREVAGEAALFADPGDSAAFARAIEHVSEDAAIRARLSAAGLAQAAKFSWEACARGTATVLAGGRHGGPVNRVPRTWLDARKLKDRDRLYGQNLGSIGSCPSRAPTASASTPASPTRRRSNCPGTSEVVRRLRLLLAE